MTVAELMGALRLLHPDLVVELPDGECANLVPPLLLMSHGLTLEEARLIIAPVGDIPDSKDGVLLAPPGWIDPRQESLVRAKG